MHPASLEARLHKGKDKDEDKQYPGDGRSSAHTLKFEGHLVDIVDDCEGGLGRAALGHHECLAEKLEGADHLDDHEEEGGRTDHGKGYKAEALPAAGAVHLGGVVQFRRHALQCGQVDNHSKAGVLPQCQDNDCRFGPVGIVQPVRRADGEAGLRPQFPDGRGQNAEIAVEEPLKYERSGHDRRHHRHEIDQPVDFEPAHALVKRNREQQAKSKLKRDDSDDEVEGVEEDFAKDSIFGEKLRVVFDADELGRGEQIPVE